MTATVVSHSAITEANLSAIFGLIAQNLATDAPYLISLNPTSKTATIILTLELSLASTSAILAGLAAIPTAPAA